MSNVKLLLLSFIFSLLSGCASTNVPVLSAEDTAASLYDDEQEIWEDADRFEKKLIESKSIVDDEALVFYMEETVSKLRAVLELSDEFKEAGVYVFNSSSLNAFVLPNGAVFITSGILSRMDNNAQLATLLGHEFIHYTNRHSLQQSRKYQNSQKFAGVLNVFVSAMAGLPATGNGGLGSVIQASILGNYSRELEEEADTQGLELMVKAGFDPHEAPDLFSILLERTDAEEEKASFFASHPKLNERLASYQQILQTKYIGQSGENNSTKHLSAIEKMTNELAILEVNKGYYKDAKKTIGLSVERYGNTAYSNYLEYELQKQDPKSEATEQELQELLFASVSGNSAPSMAYREAGFQYRKNGDNQKASLMFQRYIELKPEAPDVVVIKSFMQ